MFTTLLKTVIALLIALFYLFGHVFIDVPVQCDKGTYSTQIFAGEDDSFCYYQRISNDTSRWFMDAVEK